MICNQKLSFETVQEIRRTFDQGGISARALAERYAISYRYCLRLLQGAYRQHADTRRPIPAERMVNTRDQVQDPRGNRFYRTGRIRRFIRQIPDYTISLMKRAFEENGMTPAEIAVRFGCSLSHTRRLLKGRRSDPPRRKKKK